MKTPSNVFFSDSAELQLQGIYKSEYIDDYNNFSQGKYFLLCQFSSIIL